MRVSLDDSGAGKKSAVSEKSSGKAPKQAGGGGSGLNQAQKMKAAVAVVIIVAAAAWIGYSSGLFDKAPTRGKAIDPTPEALEQMAKEQNVPSTGGSRLAKPPMPLGAQ